MINKKYFSKIDTHNKAYVLGLIAADGSVKNKYTARIALRDKEILEDISIDIYQGENRVTQHKGNGMFCLNLCSKDLVATLNNHGIIPNKTDKLEHVMDVSNEYYNSFVLGYLDGDGTVNPKRKSESIKILGTLNFLSVMSQKIKDLCAVEGKIYFCKNHLYRLEYSGSNKIKPFIKWLYSGDSLCLSRKKEKALAILNNETLKDKNNKCVEDFLKSGLSMIDFANIHNINYSTLRNRIKRNKQEVIKDLELGN